MRNVFVLILLLTLTGVAAGQTQPSGDAHELAKQLSNPISSLISSTYDWTASHWNVPVHFTVSKLVRFGHQPVSLGGAIRCWATSSSGGPEGCGLRIIVTPLFPK
jgi:hypothetical protein